MTEETCDRCEATSIFGWDDAGRPLCLRHFEDYCDEVWSGQYDYEDELLDEEECNA